MTEKLKKEQELFDLFKLINIKTKTFRHEALYTVEDSQKLRGNIPGTHCKTLFLKDKKNGLWLIVVSEDSQINLNSLAKKMGAGRFSFCSAEVMLKILGVEPGSVTPFAIISNNARDVNVILDKKMLESNELNYHPLHNKATTTISSNDLIKFISHFGNTFKIIEIPQKYL
ncbi:MAG: Prolyl-tRNA editing protein ProX [Alphaproteobacteria bacterium MarineAlpha2_Bin1]|nr:MAG: Prolyl-tRNA editing protein ProX [Alphaproteobacteria bacterium MarineAlpha2_Bin1]